MNDNLYITGFMGAGKSTVGAALARALGRPFLDLDDLVTSSLGMPPSVAFARLGEAAFRQAESRALREVSQRQGLVVATGGGLPTLAHNRELMRASGRIVHLGTSLEACRGRLGRSEQRVRPLWRDPAALSELYRSRNAAYADCDLAVDTDQRPPEAVVGDVMASLLPDEHFTVGMNGDRVPVKATGRGPQVLAPLVEGRRVAVITDRNLERLHLDRYRQVLGDPVVMSVAPGERSKSLATSQRLYQALLQARLGRGDLLVALGGGVVTDLGAWVAATYKRGMDFMLVSTSLLGCVDAAVGGKAAVNLGPAKNVVGCFTLPRAVILDLAALATLNRRQRAEGLVEAYKTGLAASPKLTKKVQSGLDQLLAGDLDRLSEVVILSARAKGQVVARDFRESGLRRILNLGHTYGHAVEGFNRYRLSHGESVAAGTMVAAAISRARGLLQADDEQAVFRTLAPLAPDADLLPTSDEAWPIMTNDKKNLGGRVMFVLLAEPGKALWVQDVTPDELGAAIARVKEQLRG